jgi:hypothetical protein
MNYCTSNPEPRAINSILQNINTGVEYELALFYVLMKPRHQEYFLPQILHRHPYGQRAIEISKSIVQKDVSELTLNLNDLCLTTQDDTVGPSDIVLIYSDKRIGLSVKYNNTCNVNISGSYFLTKANIQHLSQIQKERTGSYIEEMTRTYGEVENWFRKRKRSKVVDQFIDLVRDQVISNWMTATLEQKSIIVNMFFQLQSPIKYYIVKIGTIKNGKLPIEIQKNIPTGPVLDQIKVVKHSTSYLDFRTNDISLGLLQVKFNNGFLEKCKGKSHDFLLGNQKANYGSPFTSWNFSI